MLSVFVPDRRFGDWLAENIRDRLIAGSLYFLDSFTVSGKVVSTREVFNSLTYASGSVSFVGRTEGFLNYLLVKHMIFNLNRFYIREIFESTRVNFPYLYLSWRRDVITSYGRGA